MCKTFNIVALDNTSFFVVQKSALIVQHYKDLIKAYHRNEKEYAPDVILI